MLNFSLGCSSPLTEDPYPHSPHPTIYHLVCGQVDVVGLFIVDIVFINATDTRAANTKNMEDLYSITL